MSEIHHRIVIEAPPARIHRALAAAGEIERWWTVRAELEEKIGGAGAFVFPGGRVTRVRIGALEPGRTVLWEVTGSFLPEWIGTRIRFALEDLGTTTVLTLAHTGFPEACACLGLCTTGWGVHLDKLRRYCEGAPASFPAVPFLVHSIPGSPYGRAVLAALEEKRAPYRLVPVAPGTSRTAAHLSRHPFGRVPVLEADGELLYEAQAILRHLDRVLPEPALTQKTPRAAARMDLLMNLNDWYLFQGVANVIALHRIVRPRLMGLPADEDAVAAALPRAHVALSELSRLLGDAPFLAGGEVSLADLLIGPQIEFLAQTPEWTALTADRPNLARYVSRMEARPSFIATTRARVSELAGAA